MYVWDFFYFFFVVAAVVGEDEREGSEGRRSQGDRHGHSAEALNLDLTERQASARLVMGLETFGLSLAAGIPGTSLLLR